MGLSCPSGARLKLLNRMLRLYQRLGLQALMSRATWLPHRLRRLNRLLPERRVDAVPPASGNSAAGDTVELFLGCVQEVQEGRPLSDALDDTGQAPGLALAMIRVGESTGALPEMLEHTSDFFDEEIEFFLTRIVTLFEPMILVVMAVIIAGLLLAVYYPLLRLVSTIA